MPYELNLSAGQVLIDGVLNHRWVIVSDPKENPERILIVNFTSWRRGEDQTCVVTPREYRSLDHDSLINYAKTREVTLDQLKRLFRSGQVSSSKEVPGDLLKKIRDGFATSKRVALKHREFLEAQGLI